MCALWRLHALPPPPAKYIQFCQREVCILAMYSKYNGNTVILSFCSVVFNIMFLAQLEPSHLNSRYQEATLRNCAKSLPQNYDIYFIGQDLIKFHT